MATPTPPARPRRAPLGARKAAAREAARERLRARITRPATTAQRALDPFAGHTSGVVPVGGALVGSAALHAAVVIGGLWAGRSDERPEDRSATAIEVRERQPVPPPPAPEPEPPAPEPVVATLPEPPPRRVEPVVPVQRPPTANEPPPPVDQPVKPPPRVVGLSLDSTQAGGEGPSFAVGNTLAGATGKRAADPDAVVPGATGPIVEQPVKPPPGPNQVATRIPTVGAKVIPPKRKKPAVLEYPELLKAQGIEADVTVIVSVGADGRTASVKIAKGSGYAELDAAAEKAAMGEEFEPAMRDGAPVTYTLSFTYRFRLEDR